MMPRYTKARSGRLVVVLMTFVLLVSACADDQEDDTSGNTTNDDSAAPSEPFLVGYTDVLSGPTSLFGAPVLDGLTAYVEDLNDSGGIDGREVELVVRDNAGVPANAVAHIQEFADQGAVAILGLSLSALTEGSIPAIERAQIPTFSNAFGGRFAPGAHYQYNTDMTPPPMMRTHIDFATDELLAGQTDVKVGIMTMEGSTVDPYIAGVVRNAETEGWELVSKQIVPPTAEDVSVQVAQIAQSDPDIIFGGMPDAVAIRTLQALRTRGIDVPVVNWHVANAHDTFTAIDNPNYYAARQYPFPTDDVDEPGFEAMWETLEPFRSEIDASSYVLFGYMEGFILHQLLERCGVDCTPEGLDELAFEIGEIDTEGRAFGPVTYTADAHQGLNSVRYYHIEEAGGEPVAIGDIYSHNVTVDELTSN